LPPPLSNSSDTAQAFGEHGGIAAYSAKTSLRLSKRTFISD